MSALLEVRDLRVEYRGLGYVNHVVNGVSFDVPAGKVVGLVGGSGAGKSTIALALLGLTRGRGRITGGSVRLDGRELVGLRPDEWERVRGGQIGLVTQNPRASLNPIRPVGEQIAAVYRAHVPASATQAAERAVDLLKTVGINDPARRMQAYPEELSGGMAQRVLIAMALACSPQLLIADEPTSGLDVTVQAQILEDLATSVAAVGSGLLLVTQDLSVVANYCDRTYYLSVGEIAEHAATPELFTQPHHPGTVALLSVQRREHWERFRLRPLPIDGRRLPPGCYLHPRCAFADAAAGCTTEHPDLRPVAPGHEVRCHRATTVASEWSRAAGGAHAGV